MTTASKLDARVEFGQARLDASSDLSDASMLAMQSKIKNSEGEIRFTLEDPELPEELREKLLHYYKEIAAIYYQSKSTNPETIRVNDRILGELIGDLAADKDLLDERVTNAKTALYSIIRITTENLRKASSLKSRVGNAAKKILGLPVGGLIAGAVTRSPLLGLAISAAEMFGQRETSGKSVFHEEQELDKRAAARANLAGVARETPVVATREQSVPQTSGHDYTAEDAELKANYSNGEQAPLTTPVGASSSNSSVPSNAATNAVVEILKNHTKLLAGTYRNSKEIVAILKGNSLTDEENAGEKSSSVLAAASGSTPTKKSGPLAGLLSMMTTMAAPIIATIGGVITSFVTGATAVAAALSGPLLAALGLVAAAGVAIYETWNAKKGLDTALDEQEQANKRGAAQTKTSFDATIAANKKKWEAANTGKKWFDGSPEAIAERNSTTTTPATPTPEITTPTPSATPASITQAPAVATSTPDTTGAAVNAPAATSAPVGGGSVKTVSGELPIDFASFAGAMGKRESGNKYDAVNTLGYLGKYQMGAPALEDLGLLKPGTWKKSQKSPNPIKAATENPNNWTIEGGKEGFLKNASLQEKAMASYTKMNYKTLKRIKAIDEHSSPEKVAGLLAASHLLGPGGAVSSMSSTDAYGTSGTSYYAIGQASQSGTKSSVSAATPAASAVTTTDQSQTGRSEIAATLASGTASIGTNGAPISINTTNQNNTMIGNSGSGRQPIRSPLDSSSTIRLLAF